MTEKFNKDELIAPAWLDHAFFQRALRSHKRDATIKVTDITLTPGTAAGEHYASVMFKCTVVYSSENDGDNLIAKLILKTMPQSDGHKMEFLKNSPAFRNEAMMYSTILPEMERLLRVAGDSTVFAPPLVYQNVHTEVSPVIVLEDISPAGWQTFHDGINDWVQVSLIIEKLAKFHALSMYLNENGFPLTEFNQHFWIEGIEDETTLLGQFVRPGFQNLMSQMPKWKGFEKYYAKLKDSLDYNGQRVVKLLSKPTGFCVLNHGDAHAKNMMFKNAGAKNEDQIFIDYQFPLWSTPALDLTYVFVMLADDRLVDTHRDDIIRLYYENFSGTLKKINYRGQIPSMLELRVSLLEAAPMELLNAFVGIPPRLFNFREQDLSDIMEDVQNTMQNISQTLHQKPEYHEYLLKKFNHLELLGVMDG